MMDREIRLLAIELAEIVDEAIRGVELFTSLIQLRRELDEHGN